MRRIILQLRIPKYTLCFILQNTRFSFVIAVSADHYKSSAAGVTVTPAFAATANAVRPSVRPPSPPDPLCS